MMGSDDSSPSLRIPEEPSLKGLEKPETHQSCPQTLQVGEHGHDDSITVIRKLLRVFIEGRQGSKNSIFDPFRKCTGASIPSQKPLFSENLFIRCGVFRDTHQHRHYVASFLRVNRGAESRDRNSFIMRWDLTLIEHLFPERINAISVRHIEPPVWLLWRRI